MVNIDEEIKRKILDQLYWDSRIDSSKIKVVVKDGAVTLSGTVPTFLARRAAFNAASTFPGVVSVEDQIRVVYSPTATIPNDKEIESNIERALDWNPEFDGCKIGVSVKDKCVTLEGSVDGYWKKVHAEELTSNTRGVVQITNKLSVIPTKSVVDDNIARQIIKALDRNVIVEPGSVSVKVEKGVVTLSGTVQNWTAKNAAFFTAVYTNGVIHVDNRLNVQQG